MTDLLLDHTPHVSYLGALRLYVARQFQAAPSTAALVS